MNVRSWHQTLKWVVAVKKFQHILFPCQKYGSKMAMTLKFSNTSTHNTFNCLKNTMFHSNLYILNELVVITVWHFTIFHVWLHHRHAPNAQMYPFFCDWWDPRNDVQIWGNQYAPKAPSQKGGALFFVGTYPPDIFLRYMLEHLELWSFFDPPCFTFIFSCPHHHRHFMIITTWSIWSITPSPIFANS